VDCDGVEKTRSVTTLCLEELAPGETHYLNVELGQAATGMPLSAPVVVVKGLEPGPVFGITAAIHGNELNGLRVLHELIPLLDPKELKGTVVAVNVLNIPGYLLNIREFDDGADLNRIMPGKAQGSCSQVYAHNILHRIVNRFEYLLDLHTASFGRANSLYVRADLLHEVTGALARLQHAQILVHNCSAEGTLRGAAARQGIHTLTIELGDPQRFQREMISAGLIGVLNCLRHLKMIPGEVIPPSKDPAILISSTWLYTSRGGILEVIPWLAEEIQAGQIVARLFDLHGRLIEEIAAPESGVVIGLSTNPASATGARVIHYGVRGTAEQMKACPAFR
jgi:predicted deacylase